MANTSQFVPAEKLAPVPQRRRALLSVEEVAELLQVPVSWVYDRTRSRGVNRIPGFRLGKYWRFDESEVMAWIERQRSNGIRNA
jgi:excisionase family DNA binding protein